MFNQYYPNNVAGFMTPNRPQARYTQPVTAEMSKMVLTTDDELSVKISPTEKIKNMCTHKYPGTQTIALVQAPGSDPADDLVTCRVCGETFHMLMDTKIEDIEAAVERMCDVLQSAKTLYLDIPEEFAKEYFQVMTLLKRAPKVFKKGASNWAGYEVSSNPMNVYQNMNSFQQVNGLVGGYNMGGINPMGMAPMANPAMGYQPVQQPVAQQQYTYNQFGQMVPVAAPVAPGENPLMYAAPVTPAPAAGVTPVAPQVAPAPAAAPTAQTGEVVQTKTFSV